MLYSEATGGTIIDDASGRQKKWQARSPVQIDVISDKDELAALKQNWQSVYKSDPDAHYFLSWDWMSKWLSDVMPESVVLAARRPTDSTYIGFLPIKLQTVAGREGRLHTAIRMAGQGVADYTGMLCPPDSEQEVIDGFAAHIKTMGWRNVILDSFRASETRMRAITSAFADSCTVSDFDVIYPDGTDHSVFPYVDLRGDWEAYLGKLSAESRRKVRRFMRLAEESGDYRISLSTPETVDRDLDIMFKFWALKWGAHPTYIEMHKTMFRHCARVGSLFLTVMWQGDRPLGALANLLDDDRQAMLFKIFSRDETFGNPSPGLVLYAYSIRNAIARGYRVCDFLQGNHRFKYSFGAQELRVFQKKISRQDEQAVLDRGSLPAALDHVRALHRGGRGAEAERIYRQILRLEPGSAEAAEGLRKLRAGAAANGAADNAGSSRVAAARELAGAGRLVEAGQVLTALLRIEPRNFQARHLLGLVGLKQGNLKAAERELRLAVKCDPDSAVAHNHLGMAVAAQGRIEQALACFEQAIALQPALAEAHRNRANALKTLGRFEEALTSYERAAGGAA